MPFFSNLADRISGYTLQLNITKDGDKLIVMVYPQVSDKDEIQKVITPLVIKGTPTELDQGFFASLGVTLDKTKQLAIQIKNYEKGLDKAANVASEADKKKPGKKESEKKGPEKEDDKQADLGLGKDEKDVPDNVDKETGEVNTIEEHTASEAKVTSPNVQKDESVTAAAADDEPVTADSPESESEPGANPEETQDVVEGSGSDQASEGQAPEEDPDEDW